MDQIVLDCKEEICQFIKARKEQKILDLLVKKNPKKSMDHEKQAINIQLESFLRKVPKVDREGLDRVVTAKNTGENKLPPLQFAKQVFEALIALAPEREKLTVIIKQYEDAVLKISEEHKPEVWLDKYAGYASGVSFATHVAKLTNSSINGASSFYVRYGSDSEQVNGYLTTDSIAKPIVDDALDNASYAPVASLLKLEVNGRTIASILIDSEFNPFKYLTNDVNKLDSWTRNFSSVFQTERLASHSLAKQVYFPTNEVELKYHLLCNVNASSLAHHIYLAVKGDEDGKKIGKLRDNHKFNKEHLSWFPNNAKLAISSASDAKNVSPLHTKRGGKLTLLSSLPPLWQSQLKPPIFKKSLFFDSSIYWQAKEDIDYLRDFLLRFDRIELSIKDPRRMKWIEKWVGNIIDEVLYYIGSIQNLQAGWSAASNIKLKLEHQHLLDPDRKDDNFQAARVSTDWLSVVCKDFADWLNNKLAGKDKLFTPQVQHTRLWHQLFEPELRELTQAMEFDRKRSMEVEA